MSGTITGTIVLNGTVTNLAGPATVDNATIEGPGTLATTGGVTVNTAHLTSGAVWSNAGTVTLASGYITGGTFVNQAGAELNLAINGNEVLVSGTLTNLGTLEDSATGVSIVRDPISDSGVIDIAGGTLDLYGGGTLAGPVTGAGTLQLGGGVFSLLSGFSHSGGLVVSNPATISLGGSVTNLAGPATLTRATIQGPGTLATTGGVTVNTAHLTGGAEWSNAGTVTLASGYITGGTFVNQAGAELNLAGSSTALRGGTLTNLGTLEAVGVSVVNDPISDSGLIDIASGTLQLYGGGGVLAGPVTGAGTLQLGGSGAVFTLLSGFSHSGGLVVNAPAAINLGGTVTNLAGAATLNGATFEGPGTLATTGGVTVNTAFLTSGAVWSNAGTVTLAGGYIAGGTFVNQAGAELNLAGSSTALRGGTLTNLGTLEAVGVSVVNDPISDSGLIDIASGTLQLYGGGGVLAGPVTGAGTLQLGGSGAVFTLLSGFSHSGGLVVNAPAAINLGGTVTNLAGAATLNGATFEGPGTLANDRRGDGQHGVPDLGGGVEQRRQRDAGGRLHRRRHVCQSGGRGAQPGGI